MRACQGRQWSYTVRRILGAAQIRPPHSVVVLTHLITAGKLQRLERKTQAEGSP
jgi:hypothetical protein